MAAQGPSIWFWVAGGGAPAATSLLPKRPMMYHLLHLLLPMFGG